MTTTGPTECPACAAGLWVQNCTYEPEQVGASTAYLAPVRDQDRARLENANLRGLLHLRSQALNRTGESNDQLRATVAACTCHPEETK